MSFDAAMETIVRGFEIAGVAVLAIGSLWALARGGRGVLRGERRGAYERARQDVGRSILLGLEILIIADIVQTITIDPTLESAATLGIIVLGPTDLSSRSRSSSRGRALAPSGQRRRLTGRASAAARRGSSRRGRQPPNGALKAPVSAARRERRPQRGDSARRAATPRRSCSPVPCRHPAATAPGVCSGGLHHAAGGP